MEWWMEGTKDGEWRRKWVKGRENVKTSPKNSELGKETEIPGGESKTHFPSLKNKPFDVIKVILLMDGFQFDLKQTFITRVCDFE